jgi:predicted metal-dependent enzyme (double-stranded beta helix superfamily)
MLYKQEHRRAANHLSDLLDSRLCSIDIEALAATLSAPTGERAWTRLVGTEDSDAWLIAWGDAGAVAAHDHGGSHGAIRVLRGLLVEEYRKPGSRLSRRQWRRRTIRPGQSIEIPPAHVHSVSNPGPAPALSLHVYSPPLQQMNFFPPDGRVEVGV